MKESYDWSVFKQKISIKNVDISRVYDSWTTRENLEKWFLRVAEFFDPSGLVKERDAVVKGGDTYRWLWYGYGDDTVEHGKILEANGKDLLRFSFTGECIVTVTIYPVAEEIMVELTQSNIPIDERSKTLYHIGCMAGWLFYLVNLKSILEGGLDLRNKKEELTQVVNA